MLEPFAFVVAVADASAEASSRVAYQSQGMGLERHCLNSFAFVFVQAVYSHYGCCQNRQTDRQPPLVPSARNDLLLRNWVDSALDLVHSHLVYSSAQLTQIKRVH